jgi:hypothetical protein
VTRRGTGRLAAALLVVAFLAGLASAARFSGRPWTPELAATGVAALTGALLLLARLRQ